MTESDPKARRLGYARVSTYGQTLDAQLEQLRKAGCGTIYREKASGARAERRELLRLLKSLARGDEVAVTRIDRLAALRQRVKCHPPCQLQSQNHQNPLKRFRRVVRVSQKPRKNGSARSSRIF